MDRKKVSTVAQIALKFLQRCTGEAISVLDNIFNTCTFTLFLAYLA